MANHVIVGAGASGLYTAYRLLKDGALPPGDTVRVYEWSERPGGRIYTYTFPEDVGGNGLYCEFGGMRFATDQDFPGSTAQGHRILQNLIIDLGLQGRVVPFGKSDNRLYYLRGQNVYENDLTDPRALPYRFNDEFMQFLAANQVTAPFTADTIIGAVAGVFAPGLGEANEDRARWCRYFADGTVPPAGATPSFPATRRRATEEGLHKRRLQWPFRQTERRAGGMRTGRGHVTAPPFPLDGSGAVRRTSARRHDLVELRAHTPPESRLGQLRLAGGEMD